MAATLDGIVESTGAVFEAKFMLPWSFSEEGAASSTRARARPTLASISGATTSVMRRWCSRSYARHSASPTRANSG